MPGYERGEGYETLDPQPPGTGEILAITATSYGIVAFRKGEPPYILRPDASEWTGLKVN